MTDGTRIPPDRLAEITGKRRPSAQVRWFAAQFGVTLPCDVSGPVISVKALEGMIAKKCGLVATDAPRPRINPNR